MSQKRRLPHHPLRLPAKVALQGPGGFENELPVEAIAVGPRGMTVLTSRRMRPGQRLRLVVEEPRGRFCRLWRWHGRVVHVQVQGLLLRVGIAFDRPEAGPADAIRWSPQSGRQVVVRWDPPWGSVPENARTREENLLR